MIAGPIFATWIAPKFKGFTDTKMIEMAEGTPKPATPPGFVISLFTIVLPVILLVFAIWETVNETSYNNLLVRTLGLPDYQYYVLKVEPPYGFSYVLHTSIAGPGGLIA